MLRDAELDLDPLSLSQPAVQIDTGESEYSHEKQIRVYQKDNDIVMATNTTTYTPLNSPNDHDFD
jgi:hypothetical protein